jgi:hypothetical protein
MRGNRAGTLISSVLFRFRLAQSIHISVEICEKILACQKLWLYLKVYYWLCGRRWENGSQYLWQHGGEREDWGLNNVLAIWLAIAEVGVEGREV